MRRLIFFFLLLLPVFWIIQGWLLPRYLESYLFPRIASNSGFTEFSCRVHHVGIDGVEVGPVEIKHENDPPLRAAAVFVSYSPFGLLTKRLKNIYISGLILPLVQREGTTLLAGLPLFSEEIAATQTPKDQEGEFQLPVQFDSVTIESSKIIYQTETQNLYLPFRFSVKFHENPQQLDINADFRLGDRNLDFEGQVNLHEHHIQGNMVVNDFPLPQAVEWWKTPSGGTMEGTADINIGFNVNFSPFTVNEATGEVRFQNLGWRAGNFHLSQSKPVTVRAVGGKNRKIGIHMTPLHFSGSAAGVFKLETLNFDPDNQGLSLEGNWSLGLNEVSYKDKFLGLDKRLDFVGDVRGGKRSGQNWLFEISASKVLDDTHGPEVITLEKHEGSLRLGKNRLACKIQSGEAHIQLDGELNLEKLRGKFKLGQVQMDELHLQGRLDLTKNGLSPVTGSRIEVLAKGIKALRDDLSIAAPRLKGGGTFVSAKNSTGFWQGEITSDQAVFDYPSHQLHGEKISISFPWKFPLVGKTKSGHLRIGKIIHKKQRLGTATVDLKQEKSGWLWKGRWKNILRPTVTLHFQGRTDNQFSYATLSYNLDHTSFDLGSALTGYYPKLGKIEARGDIYLQGKFQWKEKELTGPFLFSLKNLNYRDRKRSLQVEGGKLELKFADLAEFYATERQLLSFEKLSLADVILEKGKVGFLVGRDLEILVEKLAFDWSGGRVFSESFRVRPGVNSLDIVLYCDRVKLAQVLQQLGAAQAEGTGSLNGRIPIRYENGNFFVVDGFLFSTPGKGGILHVSGMQNLTAGLPEKNQYYGQLKLAEEALKDYEYKWARVVVNSEDDDLMIRVQMDGSPTRPLPFVYKKEFGGFVKAEANFPGTKFEGIRLDLNFRLPLNKMLEYKNLLKHINW